ncbi:MAG: hypothetical protein GY851_20650 [bacterium]|nr:hypothetical protein [bacterium]
MAQQSKIVTCSRCGLKMAIPPQYANTPGKCGKCGAMVNQQTQQQTPQAPQQPAPQQAQPAAGGAANPIDDLLGGAPVSLGSSILDSDGGLPALNLPDSDGGLPTQNLLDSDGGLPALNLPDSDGGLPTQNLLDSDGGLPTQNILGDLPAVTGTPTAPAAPQAKAAPEAGEKEARPPIFTKDLVVEFLISASIWSILSGLAVTLMMAGFLLIVTRSHTVTGEQMRDATISTALISGVDIGVLAGLLIGVIWGIVKTWEPKLITALFLGAPIGLGLSAAWHTIEVMLIADSDLTLFQMCGIGTGAGVFFAVASDRLRDWLEGDEY